MVVSYINSKLHQHYKYYSRKIVHNEPCALKNRLIRKLTTSSTLTIHDDQVNHMVATPGTIMTVTSMSNTVSSMTLNTFPKINTLLGAGLPISVFMYKFRKIACVAMLAMCCMYLRIERAPFSDRRRLVFHHKHERRYLPNSTNIPLDWLDALIKSRGKDCVLLPPTHHKTLRVTSIACKLGQGMHEVLGLPSSFKIEAYDQPGNYYYCPAWSVGPRIRKNLLIDLKDALNHMVGRESSLNIDRGYRAKNLEGLVWRMLVVESKSFRASSSQYNTLVIHTGLIDRSSDEELAFVIGHEMGHVIARHIEYMGMRNPLKDIIKEAVMLLTYLFSSDPYCLAEEEIKLEKVINNFGRRWRNEYEADQIGMMLMASAGYDPRRAPRWLSKYCSYGGPTHPTGSQRAGFLENPKRMKKAINLYRDVRSLKLIMKLIEN